MTDQSGAYRPPPEGWQDFGTHAPLSPVPPLTFSDETGEDGLPLWERHERCRCFAPIDELAHACLLEGLADIQRGGPVERLAEHVITWDDKGEPLADGKPLYVRSSTDANAPSRAESAV